MEPPSKILEKIVFKTRLKNAEHMMIVMDKPNLEENFSQALLTNNKQSKLGVIFLTAENGIVDKTTKSRKLYFAASINDDEFSKFSGQPGSYEIESSNPEIKRIFLKGEYFTEENYPVLIKPKFSTLGGINEIKTVFDTGGS